MCVTRPIHVSAGVTKNSWYGLMKPVRAKSRRYARGKGKTPRRDAGRDCGDNEVCGEIQWDICVLDIIGDQQSACYEEVP